MSTAPSVLMVGLGRMGLPIAKRLLDSGMHLHVYDTNAASVESAVACGAVAASAAQVEALAFNQVLLCLPTPAVTQQWTDVWKHAGRSTRTVIADFTTSSPSIAAANMATLKEAGIAYLDCPISGGERGAVSGDLVLTAGGDQDDYLYIEPLLKKIGNIVHYLGPIGSGSLLKAVNQSIYLAYNYVFAKGVELAVQSGLPRQVVLETLSQGAAGHPLINDRLLPKAGQKGSGVFTLERALKDLHFLEMATDDGGGAAEIHAILIREFAAAVQKGMGKEDIFSLADI